MDFINNLKLTTGQKEYLKEIERKIKKVMPGKLYRHSMNTLKFASLIAEEFRDKIDILSLYTACILHDYGKIFNCEELLKIAEENKLEISDFELNTPPLLHGSVGDYLVSGHFNISDDKILKAIRFHTTGYCNMSMEDKILFIADKVEEGRKYEGVENLRTLALKNINLCLLEVYKNNIIYIVRGNKLLHPDTTRIWNNICGGI